MAFTKDRYGITKTIVYYVILTGKNCALLSSLQEFNEIGSRLLLTFFLCLHNKLSYLHSIARIKEYRCLKKVAAFSKFYDKICVGRTLMLKSDSHA